MSVNMKKGQAISLEKPGGGGLTTVRMGLGWQAAQRKRGGLLKRLIGGGDIDLDASAVLFAGDKAEDVVYFGKLSDDDSSVVHTGDNLTGGAGQEDDESIVVMLGRLPQRIDQIVFTVNSFSGQTFTEVERAFCRLLDEDTGEELARYTLTGGGAYTAMIMAKVRRQGAGWQMTAIGAPATGRTFKDLLPAMTPHL
ncbi:TerD family protein [Streptomyces sp. NBC_01803]|uniref:TerD family protein n=1 Tax=Streptomyces sp. NBC_01803 TaxID=2975946 RepID=UPI002DDC502A|nr:TerD family protein [Streptomyces sp. NBC_01803]WSA46748.1 TerD family protein [Streptomyces sp. NBC_01803]